jgi:hypothetical protein
MTGRAMGKCNPNQEDVEDKSLLGRVFFRNRGQGSRGRGRGLGRRTPRGLGRR